MSDQLVRLRQLLGVKWDSARSVMDDIQDAADEIERLRGSEPVSTYGAVLVLDGHEEWRSEWVWQDGHWVRLAPASKHESSEGK